jgi:hypothetical protein
MTWTPQQHLGFLSVKLAEAVNATGWAIVRGIDSKIEGGNGTYREKLSRITT